MINNYAKIASRSLFAVSAGFYLDCMGQFYLAHKEGVPKKSPVVQEIYDLEKKVSEEKYNVEQNRVRSDGVSAGIYAHSTPINVDDAYMRLLFSRTELYKNESKLAEYKNNPHAMLELKIYENRPEHKLRDYRFHRAFDDMKIFAISGALGMIIGTFANIRKLKEEDPTTPPDKKYDNIQPLIPIDTAHKGA